MRKTLVIIYSAVLIIILVNYLFYKRLYNKQINYVLEMLDRQVQIVGQTVDSLNNEFLTDLNQMSHDTSLVTFFSAPEKDQEIKERMRLFYLKYKNLISGIDFYDNSRSEFTLKNDNDEWLEQTFILHVQPEIVSSEKLVSGKKIFEYYVPVTDIKTNTRFANLVVSIDYQKFFSQIFAEFNLNEYQWQWVLDEAGNIIFSNSTNHIDYINLQKKAARQDGSSLANLFHKAVIGGTRQDIISSYYSLQLLQRNLRIVFSAPVNAIQKYISRSSLLILIATLVLVQLIIFIFLRYIKSGKPEAERLKASEEILNRMIDEIPAGVIVFNRNREIIRANRIAANQFSYSNESEMLGKIYPEIQPPEDNDLYPYNPAGIFNPNHFIKIKNDSEQIVLYRYEIIDLFLDEEVTMEVLIDVTKLEAALKQEAKSNIVMSDFIARMSYEIRTPLNGIIGMADVLTRSDLTPAVRQISTLLQRSTEVLLGIVNDILDYSRIESGRIILDETPFDIRKEIIYCTDIARSTLAGREVVLLPTISDNVPEIIIGDPYRFRQVITNFISHSVKNTERGEILLNCDIVTDRNGVITLRFNLRDTGKSFDKISLKKIFGDFVNFDPASAISRDDSGFGIILSRQLIELMGGELTVVSPSGLSGSLGTQVTFTMLAYSGDRKQKILPVENLNSFDMIRTLIITGMQGRDEEVISSMHKLGLNVSTTTYLKSTINQIKANLNFPDSRYNLIVILNDKDFNGFEVAGEIWENNLTDYFVIMMISSHDVKGNYIKCLSLGVDQYLVKPFDTNELLSTISVSFPFVGEKVSAVGKGRANSDIIILVVEDNKINQKVMGTMLNNLGYSYDIAENGYEGYMMAKEKKYDLILMDLLMPDMDGYTSALKILEFDKSSIIIAVSADNSLEARKKSELAGIRDFMPKPVRINELKKLLERFL